MKFKLSCFLSFYMVMVFFLSKAHAGFVYEVLFDSDQYEDFKYLFIDKDDGADLVFGKGEEVFYYKMVDKIVMDDDSVVVYKDEHSSSKLVSDPGIQVTDKVVFLTIDLERQFFSEKINCGTKENPTPPDSNEPRLLIMNKEGKARRFQVWYKEFYQGEDEQVDSIDLAKFCVLYGDFVGSTESADAFNLTVNLDVKKNEFFARLEENIPGEDGFQIVYDLCINEEDSEDEGEDSLPATQKVDTEDQYSDESEEDKEGSGSDEDEGEDYLPATQQVKPEHQSSDENEEYEERSGSDEDEGEGYLPATQQIKPEHQSSDENEEYEERIDETKDYIEPSQKQPSYDFESDNQSPESSQSDIVADILGFSETDSKNKSSGINEDNITNRKRKRVDSSSFSNE
ncbi:hypothetical protein [Endozoicomonas sp. Mp262]|uniref:hypothetical protein n=1 Tax=Endozoicomonas sp. Mp262 TaxID=2919499 RepID=UPI0021D92141